MIPGETILSQKELGLPADPHISDFRVMHSGGGWYIGTVYVACGESSCEECSGWGPNNKKGQELEPGSRETDYFDSREKAEAALEEYKKSGDLPDARY